MGPLLTKDRKTEQAPNAEAAAQAAAVAALEAQAAALRLYAAAAEAGTCVTVDGEETFVLQLQMNKGLKYLFEHSGAKGKRCTKTAPHDATECTFIHFKPTQASLQPPNAAANATQQVGEAAASRAPSVTPPPAQAVPIQQAPPCTVSVDGNTARASDLYPTAGLTYLLSHPTAKGKSCNFAKRHPAADCGNIHWNPVAFVKAFAIAQVSMNDEMVRVCDLLPTHGLVQVLQQPDTKGRRCTITQAHSVVECTFLHPKVVKGKPMPYDVSPLEPLPMCPYNTPHDVEVCPFQHRPLKTQN